MRAQPQEDYMQLGDIVWVSINNYTAAKFKVVRVENDTFFNDVPTVTYTGEVLSPRNSSGQTIQIIVEEKSNG